MARKEDVSIPAERQPLRVEVGVPFDLFPAALPLPYVDRKLNPVVGPTNYMKQVMDIKGVGEFWISFDKSYRNSKRVNQLLAEGKRAVLATESGAVELTLQDLTSQRMAKGNFWSLRSFLQPDATCDFRLMMPRFEEKWHFEATRVKDEGISFDENGRLVFGSFEVVRTMATIEDEIGELWGFVMIPANPGFLHHQIKGEVANLV